MIFRSTTAIISRSDSTTVGQDECALGGKKSMYWQLLTIHTDDQQAILLGEVLLAQGALSVAMEDDNAGTPSENAVFDEWGKPPGPLWKHCALQAMFPVECDLSALLEHIRTSLELTALPLYTVRSIEDRDWVKSFYQDFKPLKISDRLWIVPPNHEPPDPRAVNVLLEPGLAFGSSEHATTQLCLRWLEKNIQSGETVIDYGCGSGILAIAAAKLGAGRVVGVDVDPLAITASQMNAARNNVDIMFYLPDELPSLSADVVVANILSGPLQELAPKFAGLTKAGRKIALSGIMRKQANEVRLAYEKWFIMGETFYETEWALIEGKRRG
jgi:ribosomal protein L11 methyltransferase